MQWHFWSGLTIAGLLVFRIYWGFAGPETARFARFVKGPGEHPRLCGQAVQDRTIARASDTTPSAR